MKLENLIKNINNIDDTLVIYQKGKINLESEISLLDDEETGRKIKIQKDGVEYFYLIEVFIAIDFINAWTKNFSQRPTDGEIAKRLFEYAVNDA